MREPCVERGAVRMEQRPAWSVEQRGTVRVEQRRTQVLEASVDDDETPTSWTGGSSAPAP